jgi:cupin 2 domain-containing protein
MMNNLLANIPTALTEEVVQVLVESPGVRIERIVSRGQTTASGNWYDQPDQEWVLLLQGAARLRFADQDESIEMGPGDYVHISAHRKHRVEWTAPNQPTIWLAIHFSAMADR